MTQETSSDATPNAESGSGDLFNTTAGWVLFAAGLGLGLSIIANKMFHAYHNEAPETPGYPIVVAGGGEEAAEMTMDAALNMMPQDELIAAGERVFQKCGSCHTIEQGGANGQGPNLYGVMGSPKGNHAGFGYSTAMTGFGGTWGWEEMNQWLDSPRRYIEGTTMGFAGISSIEDRAAVAVYINSFGSNLPIPEYVEEAAADSTAELEAEAETDVEGEAAAEQDAGEQIAEAAAE